MKIKTNWMKRAMAGFTVATIAFGVSGCGQQGGEMIMEDPNTVPETPYEINWFLPGTVQRDVASVENEINSYLKDKLNATVKINILENAQYKDKLSNMIQAGEYFDMCFAANWMLDYPVNAENGAFVEFDELLPKYMPKTLEMSDPMALECVKVTDKIYGLPVIKENATCYGWVYRKDLADKYNIDMTTVKTHKDLAEVARIIKANEPDIKYPIDWALDTCPAGGALLDFRVSTANNLGFLYSDKEVKIVKRLDQPEVLEGARLAHELYKEGLVKEDILTNFNDHSTRMKNGQTFAMLAPLKPGKVKEDYKNLNFELEQIEITEPKMPTNPGISSMMVISATSKNPARVARFIELLNTDKYLYNLVIFGIEGKHYEKVSDNVVKVIADSGYTLGSSQWMIGNVYNSYTTVEEDPDKYIKLKAFDEGAKPSKIAGFNFVTDTVQTELATVATVDAQYNAQLLLGAIDPDTIIDDYKAALESAGLDKIQAELQRQIDEYLASK